MIAATKSPEALANARKSIDAMLFLEEVTKANPGMQFIELDIDDPASIAAVAKKLIAEHPKLNVVINNAGIMKMDDASGAVDDEVIVSTLTTNLGNEVTRAQAAGMVRANVNTGDAAHALVAQIEGTLSLARNSQDPETLMTGARGLRQYLESLRAEH